MADWIKSYPQLFGTETPDYIHKLGKLRREFQIMIKQIVFVRLAARAFERHLVAASPQARADRI